MVEVERDRRIGEIKSSRYECFIEDHQPLPWTPGQCAGYAGSGSMALHLFRCKRRSGHGIGELFCKQHAAEYERRTALQPKPQEGGEK